MQPDTPQPTPVDAWSLTDKAAIILKSYGVDDPAAARAVVALVLEEAVQVARKQQRPSYVKDFRDGYEVARADIISAIRALIPGGKP